MPTTPPTPTPTPDLVNVQKNVATLDNLIVNYNQLYKTYLQQVESESNKRHKRKYPYNITNPNEFKNNLNPAVPFPSNGTEDACFKSCVDADDCVYALYSNSGCGIDCNPNKCLLYGVNANGISPVKEMQTELPQCPVSGDAAGSDAWCKTFNNPVTNAVIPALVLRTGATNWRDLAVKMPNSTANAADAPMSVDLTTNVQTWGPDSQFSDVNYAPSNEISMQFRFFAEYWLNAYGIMSGSAPVVAGQGPIGTFAFTKLKLSPNAAQQCNWKDTTQCIFKDYTMNGDGTSCSVQGTDSYSVSGLASYNESDLMGWLQALYNTNGGYTAKVYQYWNTCKTVPGYEFLANLNFAKPSQMDDDSDKPVVSYVGTFAGQTMFWNSADPPTGGTDAGEKMAAALAASDTESAKFNYNYSAFKKPVWKITPNMNAMKDQLPPQLAQTSIPSWQFLGMQDSAEACQTAATNDPDHVYTMATYYNASYDNSNNGNNAFARMCYGHVAGAPSSTVSSSQEDNVQTMTPPHGYTKLGGKPGIAILKQMYKLNKQIMALTDELKIVKPSSTLTTLPTKEAFTQQQTDGVGDDDNAAQRLSELAKKLKTDEIKLNDAIQDHVQLDADEKNARQLLLYSRIKFGMALILGLLLAYLAYRFLMADELPETVAAELTPMYANANANANMET